MQVYMHQLCRVRRCARIRRYICITYGRSSTHKPKYFGTLSTEACQSSN
jgi:hypothetical protein